MLELDMPRPSQVVTPPHHGLDIDTDPPHLSGRRKRRGRRRDDLLVMVVVVVVRGRCALLLQLPPHAEVIEQVARDDLVAPLEGDGVVPALAVLSERQGGALQTADTALEVVDHHPRPH